MRHPRSTHNAAVSAASLILEICVFASYAQLSGQEKKAGLYVQHCTGRRVTLGFRSAIEINHYIGNMQVAYKFITASPSGMISRSITCGRCLYTHELRTVKEEVKVKAVTLLNSLSTTP